jgi:chemotaxis signal transduction protein
VTSGRAADLRRAFDLSFAEPPREHDTRFETLLAIRVGSERFALRLRDIAALIADKTVTAVPTTVAELMGVAGFRGEIVPVYDLRALLGSPSREPTRWLALAPPVALAFDAFDGQLRALPDTITAEPSGDRNEHTREVVRTEDGKIPIVDVGSLLEAIKRRLPKDR